MKTKIWFTADTHFSHRNVLKHCQNRISVCGATDENDIKSHDKWLIELWNKTVAKNDTVYILGDFSFKSTDETKKLLGKLNGNKFLILGNHDKSSQHLDGYFKQITQIKEVTFKKANYPILDCDLSVCMSHYPLLDWPCKRYGTVMLHGHTHGNMDDVNNNSNDLRVDVGLDGEFANYSFISLDKIQLYVKEKQEFINENG